jgi:hypothetical protein
VPLSMIAVTLAIVACVASARRFAHAAPKAA